MPAPLSLAQLLTSSSCQVVKTPAITASLHQYKNPLQPNFLTFNLYHPSRHVNALVTQDAVPYHPDRCLGKLSPRSRPLILPSPPSSFTPPYLPTSHHPRPTAVLRSTSRRTLPLGPSLFRFLTRAGARERFGARAVLRHPSVRDWSLHESARGKAMIGRVCQLLIRSYPFWIRVGRERARSDLPSTRLSLRPSWKR